MAKAKSKKITLEEALVPVEEQPYAGELVLDLLIEWIC